MSMDFDKVGKLPETERRAKAFKDEAEANAALRAVKDELGFRNFEHRLACTCYYRHSELQGKRRGYHAYAFTAIPWKPTEAHYLFDDGISTGRSQWKNLWRSLRVRLWPLPGQGTP